MSLVSLSNYLGLDHWAERKLAVCNRILIWVWILKTVLTRDRRDIAWMWHLLGPVGCPWLCPMCPIPYPVGKSSLWSAGQVVFSEQSEEIFTGEQTWMEQGTEYKSELKRVPTSWGPFWAFPSDSQGVNCPVCPMRGILPWGVLCLGRKVYISQAG